MKSFKAPAEPTLPLEVEDRSAWYGQNLAKCEDWIERLCEVEIDEVEQAFRQLDAKGSGIDLTSITAKDLPLPTLALRLHRLLDEVLNGRGFVLIKGLPVERWTSREAALAFLVIGHLGSLRMQNAEGHLLGHVRDLGGSTMIRIHVSIRRVNGRLIIQIHVTLLVYCV
jgi:hypothetical protein